MAGAAPASDRSEEEGGAEVWFDHASSCEDPLDAAGPVPETGKPSPRGPIAGRRGSKAQEELVGRESELRDGWKNVLSPRDTRTPTEDPKVAPGSGDLQPELRKQPLREHVATDGSHSSGSNYQSAGGGGQQNGTLDKDVSHNLPEGSQQLLDLSHKNTPDSPDDGEPPSPGTGTRKPSRKRLFGVNKDESTENVAEIKGSQSPRANDATSATSKNLQRTKSFPSQTEDKVPCTEEPLSPTSLKDLRKRGSLSGALPNGELDDPTVEFGARHRAKALLKSPITSPPPEAETTGESSVLHRAKSRLKSPITTPPPEEETAEAFEDPDASEAFQDPETPAPEEVQGKLDSRRSSLQKKDSKWASAIGDVMSTGKKKKGGKHKSSGGKDSQKERSDAAASKEDASADTVKSEGDDDSTVKRKRKAGKPKASSGTGEDDCSAGSALSEGEDDNTVASKDIQWNDDGDSAIENGDDNDAEESGGHVTARKVGMSQEQHNSQGVGAFAIDEEHFEELVLSDAIITAVKDAWKQLQTAAGSGEAVGEALYNAFYDAAPSLQGLFVSPKAVASMKFKDGINSLVRTLDDAPSLKALVEDLAFRHMMFEINIPRITLFRDAIIEVLEVELGDNWTRDAQLGWFQLLNYCGGAMIYIKIQYSSQLKTLQESWAVVRSKNADNDGTIQANKVEEEETHALRGKDKSAKMPTSFDEMLHFNATVMGCAQTVWLNEVLAHFDAIVQNVSNAVRLQEECEVVALKLSKHGSQNVDLSVFKACMLAALRSLLPREWSTSHETAWSWLWENVEKTVKKNLSLPAKYHQVLEGFMDNLTEETRLDFGKATFKRLFELAPSSQHFFKQSNSRLYFIADQVLVKALQLYRNPVDTVNDLCALGLLHVGFGVPIDLFGPFVTSCVDVVQAMVKDHTIVESFMFSLSLIAKIMVRTITEGRTVVMLAINANSTKQLHRAMSCAPRSLRATWLLRVQVGSQRISPLIYAIENGQMEVADVMLADILQIRADRDRYYYGLYELWERHADIIKRLLSEAPHLMVTFLDGLIWRSKNTHAGLRRVNYYVEHMIIDKEEGDFSDALDWIVDSHNPKLIAHQALVLVSDTLWLGIVRKQFMLGQLPFIVGLFVFTISHAVLPSFTDGNQDDMIVRYMIFGGRVINHCFTLPRLMYYHISMVYSEWSRKETVTVGTFEVPECLCNMHHCSSLVLTVMLFLMIVHEPAIYCIGSENRFYEFLQPECAPAVTERYQILTMGSMILFWILMINLSVFSTALSAFVLVLEKVLSEIGRFLAALFLLFFMFASGVSAHEHNQPHFRTVEGSVISLSAITVGMFEPDYETLLREELPLLLAIVIFMGVCLILLVNLLIAQLSCSYVFIFQDMVGFARLHRASIIVKILKNCKKKENTFPNEKLWMGFLSTLAFDVPLELNEGDLGPAPGISIYEPATSNSSIEALDSIKRFGGDTSPDQPWPEEKDMISGTRMEDRVEILEQLVKKVVRKLSGKKHKSRAGTLGGGSSAARQSEGVSSSGNGSDVQSVSSADSVA